MELLFLMLPKDLVNIIDEYAKDRTNYEKVMKHLRKMGRKAWSHHRWGLTLSQAILKHVKWQNKVLQTRSFRLRQKIQDRQNRKEESQNHARNLGPSILSCSCEEFHRGDLKLFARRNFGVGD